MQPTLALPWRSQICDAKFLHPYNGDLSENLGKNTAQECQ